MTTRVLLSKDGQQAEFIDLWDGDDEQILRRVRRTLTSAELASLGSNPVELLPAQPGKVYWPVAGLALYKVGGTPYDTGSGYLLVGPPGTPGGLLLTSLEVLLASTEDAVIALQQGFPFPPGTALPLAQYQGQPLATWAEADPAGGNGTVTVGILYRVVTVAPPEAVGP